MYSGFGDVEKDQPVKKLRGKEEMERPKETVSKGNDEESNSEEEIEEIHQMGLYKSGESRSLWINFKSQCAANEVLRGKWRLNQMQEFKHVKVRKDLKY